MADEIYNAPDRGVANAGQQRNAGDNGFAAPNGDTVPPETFSLALGRKNEVFTDISDVEHATHVLHNNLMKNTASYQSASLLSTVAGAAVGLGTSFSALASYRQKIAAKADAQFEELDKVFQPVRDVARHGVMSNNASSAVHMDSDRLIDQFVKSIKTQKNIRDAIAQKDGHDMQPQSEHVIASSEHVEEKIGQLYDKHFSDRLERLGVPREEAQLGKSYLNRVVKDSIKTRLGSQLPQWQASLDNMFEHSAPVSNAAKHNLTDFFSKQHAGAMYHDISHVAILAGATAAAAVAGSVVHAIADAPRRRELDEVNQQVTALNRVMLSHNRPMVDMSDIPSSSMNERIQQEDARHRRIQLKAHDEVIAKHQEIKDSRQKQPQTQGVSSVAHEGTAKNVSQINQQFSV